MKTYKVQDFVVEGKEIFVGLEDSKKCWKIAVRCEHMLIHQASMEARYPSLKQYLKNKFPDCPDPLDVRGGVQGFQSL